LSELIDLKPVHRGRLHVVERGRRDGADVIVKRPSNDRPVPRALFTLLHEADLLAGHRIPGLVRSLGLTTHEGLPALLLEPAGDWTLNQRLEHQPLPLDEFLSRARSLCATVAGLHEAEVIHRDINPNNVVLDGETTTLIDLSLATRFSRVPAAKVDSMTGTAAYTSPEQTGRTGLLVDERSDLYSLGATFYAMLAGHPPFAGGPNALLHAHVARRAPPLKELAPAVPDIVCDVIHRLLSKRPEERYQSAGGVQADLDEIHRRRRRGESLGSVMLGESDRPAGLRLPQGLYGRDATLDRLKARLSDAERAPRLALLSGEPGMGRTALLSRLHLHALRIERRAGLAAAVPDAPDAVLLVALERALEGLATASGPERSAVAQALLEECGPTTAALIPLLPPLVSLLGPLESAPELAPEPHRQRRRNGLVGLVRALGRPAGGLLLAFDDLDQADESTLAVLREALSDGAPGVLVVGTVSPASLEPGGRLATTLEQLQATGATVAVEELHPLELPAMEEFAAEALGTTTAAVASLAARLQSEADGNPRTAWTALRRLRSEGTLAHGPDGRWRWPDELDTGTLQALGDGTTVLPGATQRALAVGALLGGAFELQGVAELLSVPVRVAALTLQPAIDAGLLVPLADSLLLSRELPDDALLAGLELRFRFAYPAFQEEALEALEDDERRCLHLAAADACPDTPAGRDARLNHWVQAGDGLPAAAHPLAVATAHRVAQEALPTSASRSAEAAAAGLRWLDAGTDSATADDAFELLCLASRAEAGRGNGEAAGALLERADGSADMLRRARVAALRTQHAVVTGEHAAALTALRAGLTLVGAPVPTDPGASANAGLAEAAIELGRAGVASLADTEQDDERVLAEMDLLDAAIPSAFFTDQPLFRFIIARMLRLTLDHGVGPRSAYPLVFCALEFRGIDQPELARDLGQFSLQLARDRSDPAYLCRVLFTWAHHLQHWSGPLRDNLSLFVEAERSGLAAGDRQWAGYALTGALLGFLPAQEPLDQVEEALARGLPFLHRTANHPMIAMAVPIRQTVRFLRGDTLDALDDAEFSEDRFLADMGEVPAIRSLYGVSRLMVAVLDQDWPRARAEDALVEELRPFINGMAMNSDHALYGGLAAVAPDQPPDLARAKVHLARLELAAEGMPENFAHRVQLLKAAIADTRGDRLGALDGFDDAAEAAEAGDWHADCALANQLAGESLLRARRTTPAQAYLARAARGWQEWGADGLSAQLMARYPDAASLRTTGVWSVPIRTSDHSSESDDGAQVGRLDLEALLGAAEAIASELDPGALAQRLLQTLVEMSGAQRGVLLRARPDGLALVAQLDADGEYTLRQGLAHHCDDLPGSVVQWVERNGRPLVLESAAGDARFAQDPVVRARGTQAVLCLPAARQQRLVSIVYLENDLTPGAFAPARAQLLGLLAAQVASALENAELFGQLRQETADRLQAEQRLQRVQRLESVGRLASGVAHDFNNLLGVILGWARMILDSDDDSLDAHDAMDQIARAAERGATLTRQLLAFSRASVAHPQDVDLPSMLADLTRMLDRLVGDRIRLVRDEPPEGLPTAHVDSALLEQVLINLIVNARDAMPDGGIIRLGLRAEDLHEVRPSAYGAEPLPPGHYAVLSVVDDGDGIPEDLLNRIFEPFFTTKTVDRGSGLGLATCLGITEQSGGTITVRSEPGEGTTFDVWLPAGESIGRPEAVSPARPAKRAHGQRLLIVEDDQTLRDLLVVICRSRGFEPAAAVDGEHALKLLQEQPFDLLLTDYTMPGMDGLQLAEAARSLRPGLPIAMLSGVAEILDADPEAGAEGVLLLQKPIQPNDLVAALLRLLRATAGEDAADDPDASS